MPHRTIESYSADSQAIIRRFAIFMRHYLEDFNGAAKGGGLVVRESVGRDQR